MLENKSIILASKSPRRKQLLSELGLNFEVKANEIEEVYPDDLPKKEIPEYLSKLKANASKEFITKDEIIIAADTIVILENEVLGKPAGESGAIEILQKLSGKMHTVVSGVTLLNKNKEKSFSVSTHVYFKELRLEDIELYVTKYQPLDKAGAYAIQEWIGMIGIEKIEGCYYNVVGLPLSKLVEELNVF